MADDRLAVCMALNGVQQFSQFTNYNFNSFIELEDGSFIGLNEDGLYALSGDDDDGDYIDARVKFATTDFGYLLKKRLRYVYVYGKFFGLMDVVVSANDGADDTFANTTITIDGKQNRIRVTVDGTEGHAWAVEIQNESGADFSIDAVDVLVLKMDKM